MGLILNGDWNTGPGANVLTQAAFEHARSRDQGYDATFLAPIVGDFYDPKADLSMFVLAIQRPPRGYQPPKLFLGEKSVRQQLRHMPFHVWKQHGAPLSVEQWCKRNPFGCEVVLVKPISIEAYE